MSHRNLLFALALTWALIILAGCPTAAPKDPEGYTGEVEIGDATQIVPLYVDTALTLWDDCTCSYPIALPPGTADIACSTPGQVQNNAFIGLELGAPQGSDGSGVVFCSLFLTFMMDDDTTGLIPRHQGTVICDLSHNGTVDAFNYDIIIKVSLLGEFGTIDTQEFRFCEVSVTGFLPELGEVISCDQPYASGSEQVQFDHLFEAGQHYQLGIDVSGNLGASSGQQVSFWGGNITFGLDVDNVQIQF